MVARISLLLALVSLASPFAQGADAPLRVVSVSGQGLVRVAPDRVTIGIEVTTNDDDLIRVRETSDSDAKTLLTLAKKHGVLESGFDVEEMSITFDYNEQLRRQIYTVARKVTLQLDDLNKLNGLIADLLKEKNAKIDGVSFTSSRLKELEVEARKSAVADAKAKAKQLAELNDLKLGKARQIQIVSEGSVPFVTSVVPVVGAVPTIKSRTVAGSFLYPPALDAKLAGFFLLFAPGDDPAKPFALGQLEVTAAVAVEFEMLE